MNRGARKDKEMEGVRTDLPGAGEPGTKGPGEARGRAEEAGSAVVLRDLSVAFHGKTVLREANLAFPQGGLTVLVGPNGAGKTTLLLCLAGEVPHSGRLVLAPGVEGHIGYVPQNLQMQTGTPMTCREFLALNTARRPVWLGIGARTRARVDGILERVGMGGCGERGIGELSGGELRRVLLAQALLRDPVLLLLDEPAAGVDMRGERLFWELLQDVRRERGITVVMVSHNLSLAAHYATHIVCVSRGECQQGTPRAVLTARNLISVFGIPIHLYPEQCTVPQLLCPKCGAFEVEDPPSGAASLSGCGCGQAAPCPVRSPVAGPPGTASEAVPDGKTEESALFPGRNADGEARP